MGISIDKSVKPVAQAYRQIPIPLEVAVEQKIDQWLSLGIIEQVATSEWISPLVVAPKNNGEVRLCVDMRQANKAVIREKFVMPTVENLLPLLYGCGYFGKLDIKDAFHQLELAEWCRHITTFITKRGLFRFKRLMFGISCAPEIFQKVIQRVLLGLKNCFNYLDDIIVFAKSREELVNFMNEVKGRLDSYNIVLNMEKCVFETTKLQFLGHTITKEGIKPDNEKLRLIKEFRPPNSIEEMQSFLGLVIYVGSRFIPNISTMTEPLRSICKKGVTFEWKKEQHVAFELLKSAMSQELILGYYSPENRTQLYTDASPVGLGAVLVQWHEERSNIIAFASKTLTDVERRYCQTEKEALSLVWGVERFKNYLIGIEFELLTDHKPLEVIFGPKSRPCARIERWVLRLQSFKFKVIYVKGKNNIADSLSRLCQTKMEAVAFDEEIEDQIRQVVCSVKPVAISMEKFEEESNTDPEIKEVKEALHTGRWPENIKRYKLLEIELCLVEGMLLRGTRLVVPLALRTEILELAHEGHPGVVSMKGRLRCKVWWIGMDKDVEKFVKTCKACTMVGPLNPPEPMNRRKIPEQAWEDVAIDFLGPLPSDEYLLVIVDYFSRYMEVITMKSITAELTIKELKTVFSRFGIPKSITADNGPQFRGEEFKSFCLEFGIELNLSIPYWPQMNGEVERQNRTIMKRLKIAKIEQKNWKDELQNFLLMYRVSPHAVTGKTPAELMFGRKIRDKIPSISNNKETFQDEETKDKDSWEKEKGREYGNKKRNAKEADLNIGDTVLVKNMIRDNKLTPTFGVKEHVIVSKNMNDVKIQDNAGKISRRSASHLKKLNGLNDEDKQSQDEEAAKEEEVCPEIRIKRVKKIPSRYR